MISTPGEIRLPQRVKMTDLAIRNRVHVSGYKQKATTGSWVSSSKDGRFINVIRDGCVAPTQWAAEYWELE
jgi:hypothetical protein